MERYVRRLQFKKKKEAGVGPYKKSQQNFGVKKCWANFQYWTLEGEKVIIFLSWKCSLKLTGWSEKNKKAEIETLFCPKSFAFSVK